MKKISFTVAVPIFAIIIGAVFLSRLNTVGRSRRHSFDDESDPITAEQITTLRRLLDEEWSDKAKKGFLVIAGRFVDWTGTDRTAELAPLFRTDSAVGKRALRESLEALLDSVGSLKKFVRDYPVYVNHPKFGSVGAYPQLPILGISKLYPVLYRLFGTADTVFNSSTHETVRDYIVRTGRLPRVELFPGWVLRKKPYFYWCSYEQFATPNEAKSALQIIEKWSRDCKMRATLPTEGLNGLVFVAYSGVSEYPEYLINKSKDKTDSFAGYNVELLTTDHPELPGGGMQVAVVGEPKVVLLEEWSDTRNTWEMIYSANEA